MLELRIHGYGGQGAVTLAHLLATAALFDGSQGQALPSFGVERRGSPVKAVVRISDEMIRVHSQSIEPDILVLMSEHLLERALNEGHKADARILYNGVEEIVAPLPTYRVDADGIATSAGLLSPNGPFINVPMFGACCRLIDIPLNAMEQAIRQQWHGAAAEKNLQVATTAYQGMIMGIGGEKA